MNIVIATGNKDKFREIAKTLNEFGIRSSQVETDVEEKGSSLEDIVVDKAKKAFSKVKQPLIVDDTGVYFEAYEDFPGAFAKRTVEKIGLAGLLKKIEGMDRRAFFKTLICYIDENGYEIFEGKLEGNIDKKIHGIGRKDFPYDRIFLPFGYNIPMCALNLDEITRISHRAQATRKFASWIKSASKKR